MSMAQAFPIVVKSAAYIEKPVGRKPTLTMINL